MSGMPDSVSPRLKLFSRSVYEEAKACFKRIAPSATYTDQAAVPAQTSLVHLVSVGGLQLQDLPMSGRLQATDCLQQSPHLLALLSCFIAPLGRVYLVHQPRTEKTSSVLYQNAAHKQFYQTVYLPLMHYAIEDIDLPQPFVWTGNLHDSLGLSPFCLAVEVAKPNNDTECYSNEQLLEEDALFDSCNLYGLIQTGVDQRKPLQTVPERLDILSPALIEQILSVIMTTSYPFLNECDRQPFEQASQKFLQQWISLFAQFGRDYCGEWSYQSALNQFRDTVMKSIYPLLHKMSVDNQQATKKALDSISFQLTLFPSSPQRVSRKVLTKSRRRKSMDACPLSTFPHFERPLFIVSAPRAGSTLLFETLVRFNRVWSTGEENHAQLEAIEGLHPRDHHWHSNRLGAEDANESIQRQVIQVFTRQLQNYKQHFLAIPETERPANIRFVEKTPKNALRIPFIKALFPDALFIYLHREAKSNISSLIDGWRSQRFIAYQNLPGFDYRHWSFLLIPEWRELHDRSIGEIATRQWQASNQIIQNDLSQLPEQDWMALDYQDLLDQPEATLKAISRFAGFGWDSSVAERCKQGLPVSRLTLSSPQKDKWMKHQSLMKIDHKITCTHAPHISNRNLSRAVL